MITININLLDYENLREYHALNNYIENCYQPDMRNFVMIDEVQMCQGFEYAIIAYIPRRNMIFTLLVRMPFC